LPWHRDQLDAWAVFLVPLWLLGVLLLSTRLAAGWLIVQRVRRTATPFAQAEWCARIPALARELGLTQRVRVLESAAIVVPTVIGWLRPALLVPASGITGLSPQQIEAVIAHELAHIRRHDYLVNLWQTAVETLYFYHPATWWISRHIRTEREHCCDDLAIAVCGNRGLYARTLVDVAQTLIDQESHRTRVAFGLGMGDGPLTRRVRRVLSRPSEHTHRSTSWIVTAVMLGASFVVIHAAATGLLGDGIVRGRVVDADSGQPVIGASIELSGRGGWRDLTDADGRYEATAIAPGEYTLFVEAEGYIATQYGQRDLSESGLTIEVRPGQILTGLDVRLRRSGSVSGRILGHSGDGLSGIEVVAQRYVPGGVLTPAIGGAARGWAAQTDESGQFRVSDLPPGQYSIRAYTSQLLHVSREDPVKVYGPTYFPGVIHMEEVQPIAVVAGQETFDATFAMVTVDTRSVSGMLVDPGGPPLDRARVLLMPGGFTGGTGRRSQPVPVSPDGRFEIRDVIRGSYELLVQDPILPSRWLAALQPFTVNDDVTGLEVVARYGSRVEGIIVREGGGSLPFAPATIRVRSEIRIEVQPGVRLSTSFSTGDDGLVRPDWTFSHHHIVGPSGFEVMGLPAGWFIKTVRLDGVDVTDRTIDLGEGATRRLEVILTDRLGGIVGAVTDASGRAVPNYSVVVFSQDRSRWSAPSRFVRGVRARADGSYRIDELLPADYLAVAVESLPSNAWMDPKVLDRLSSEAIRVTLADGERRNLTVRLSPTLVGMAVER
jgi:hypothetical protein